MNEKEIAKEIMRQQWGCEGAIWNGLPMEVVQEWGETISYWLEIANHKAAAAIVKRVREDRGTTVSCDTMECLYNDNGECTQDDIHLNAYEMCESVDTG